MQLSKQSRKNQFLIQFFVTLDVSDYHLEKDKMRLFGGFLLH